MIGNTAFFEFFFDTLKIRRHGGFSNLKGARTGGLRDRGVYILRADGKC